MNLTYKTIDPASTIPERHIPGQLNILASPVTAKITTMTSCAAPTPTTLALTLTGPSTGKMAHHASNEVEELLQKYEARIRELEQENAKLRHQQVEIQKAKELYLKIFEDFPALIWRSRLDKMCDYFNRTWLEWTGKTLDQEFGNGWTDGVHKDDFDRCLDTYVQAFDSREPFYMEYRLLDRHHQYRWIGDHGRPFYDLDGTFLGYIGSCYDITENKQNEQALIKLNATKDKFFSIVAHDLRNPIATFVSVSEMLMDDAEEFDPQELKEIATQMHKDSKNTLLLLENLLDWSKTQSHEIQYQPAPLHLPDLCRQVLSQVELCALAKQIRVHYQDTVPDWTIAADKNMLNTVLRNLIMNAIKYTHPGGQIDILASNMDNNLLMQVRDTGVGMTQDQIQGLFSLPGERGSKYSSSTSGTHNEGGSGLGLVICRDFVHNHGGTLWAESQPENGTTFSFTIPWDSFS